MTLEVSAAFGAGGAEPYASALGPGDSTMLYLSEVGGRSTRATMDVSRWNADADSVDLMLLDAVRGPVLDIGSGPGRMVRAANLRGMVALGIDVSAAAVQLASSIGGEFLQASVFDALPREGRWQTALLVDGNVGIGGDVRALLARCNGLLATEGEIVVEVDIDASHEKHYVGEVVDSRGRRSGSFPWAEIGRDRLAELLPGLGLELAQSWTVGGRSFCRLAKTA